MIKVSKVDQNAFDVTVKASHPTTHRVTVPEAYYQKLVDGKECSVETLIEKSFEFLLERESNTMIFSQFELPVIQSYFPEYENVIGKRL